MKSPIKHKLYSPLNAYIFTRVFLLLVMMHGSALASDIIILRSDQSFPEAMSSLQAAITNSGNTLSRIQRIDVGLTKMGYQTDRYRVVFYGKLEQINRLVVSHPELIPYLPLKIAIFSENGQTLLVATNPDQLIQMYPDKALEPIFQAWSSDLRAIMDEVQKASDDDSKS